MFEPMVRAALALWLCFFTAGHLQAQSEAPPETLESRAIRGYYNYLCYFSGTLDHGTPNSSIEVLSGHLDWFERQFLVPSLKIADPALALSPALQQELRSEEQKLKTFFPGAETLKAWLTRMGTPDLGLKQIQKDFRNFFRALLNAARRRLKDPLEIREMEMVEAELFHLINHRLSTTIPGVDTFMVLETYKFFAHLLDQLGQFYSPFFRWGIRPVESYFNFVDQSQAIGIGEMAKIWDHYRWLRPPHPPTPNLREKPVPPPQVTPSSSSTAGVADSLFADPSIRPEIPPMASPWKGDLREVVPNRSNLLHSIRMWKENNGVSAADLDTRAYYSDILTRTRTTPPLLSPTEN